MRPRVVILDPELTTGLASGATAACGMDVLTHAVEAYTSTAANPYADALTTDALRDLIILNTPRLPIRDEVRELYRLAMRARSTSPVSGESPQANAIRNGGRPVQMGGSPP